MFDEKDIDYLVANLTSAQLRKEIHTAAVQEGVSRCFAEDDTVFYWQQFAKACRAALAVQKPEEPKREVRSGKVSIEATKERHGILDVVAKYTDLQQYGREYMGRCPFHEDRQPSLEVNPEKGLFYCFSCHRKGDVINFIMDAENMTTKEACLFLDSKTDLVKQEA